MWSGQLQGVTQATFHDCVDVEDYPFHDRSRGENIAFIGYLGHKKGVGLLVQCIQAAAAKDASYRFHIAGSFQEKRFEIYFKHAVKSLGLADRVRLHGWVKDIPAFLADMNYVISTSPWEGCPNNVIEALACGIKPLVHNWNGAADLYPPELVFNTVGEFLDRLVSGPYDSTSFRNLARRDFDSARVLPALDAFLAGLPRLSERAANHRPVQSGSSRQPPGLPEAVSDPKPDVRLQGLLLAASDRINAGDKAAARNILEKMARMNGYDSADLVNALSNLYREQQDIPALKGLWKRTAIAALHNGNLDRFLESAYISIYAENHFSREPNYRFAWIDEDLDAFIRQAAKSHPMWQAGQANRRRFTPHADGRLRIGFVLEGLSQTQSPIRNFLPLAEHADPSLTAMWFFSRWSHKEPLAIKEGYARTEEELRAMGAQVVHPEEPLRPSDQVGFLAREIIRARIDILVFQTTYFVPVYNLLAALRLAPFQAAIEHQQPEFGRDLDLVFTTRKQALESPAETASFPISRFRRGLTGTGMDRKSLGLPEGAIVMVSSNRENRYSQSGFWNEMLAVLESHPSSWFMAIGLSGKTGLPEPENPAWDRVSAPGFRTDVLECLALSDFYVDIFPSGGGSSLIEAMQMGLPVVGFDQNMVSAFSIQDESLAAEYVGEKELIAPYGDMAAWRTLMDRLLTDPDFRSSMSARMLARAETFLPEKVARRFHENLASAYRSKRERSI